jgi:hypothetical protein
MCHGAVRITLISSRTNRQVAEVWLIQRGPPRGFQGRLAARVDGATSDLSVPFVSYRISRSQRVAHRSDGSSKQVRIRPEAPPSRRRFNRWEPAGHSDLEYKSLELAKVLASIPRAVGPAPAPGLVSLEQASELGRIAIPSPLTRAGHSGIEGSGRVKPASFPEPADVGVAQSRISSTV